MSSYRTSVDVAVSAATAFAGELNQQLDVKGGGFAWWRGHTDPKRLILIGDYLIQSVLGIAESLLDASLSCDDHGEALFADNTWVVQTAAAVERTKANATNDDHLHALRRDGNTDRRDRRISMTADSCLIYLVQCLDRCAAMVAIVGALPLDVLKVGWGQIAGLKRNDLAPRKRRQRIVNSLPDEAGLDAQVDLVEQLSRWEGLGPTGWLPWLLETRHAHAHRAQPTSWQFVMVDRRQGTGLCRPFYLKPQLSEMHSLAQQAPGDRDMSGHLLLEQSIDVLRGLLASTTALSAHLVEASRALWDARRATPDLLIQPGNQWRLEDAQSDSAFVGFGVPAPIQKDASLHIHPSLARRVQAAKVLDTDSHYWRVEP